MAQAVQVLVEKSEGKEQHAVQSFANALRQLPTIMADNAGLGTQKQSYKIDSSFLIARKSIFIKLSNLLRALDSADLIAKLRAEHAKGNKHAGLDLYNGMKL